MIAKHAVCTPLRLDWPGPSAQPYSGRWATENRLEHTIIGEVVNLAAKLEKHTKAEAVEALVTRQAFELAVEQGYQPRIVSSNGRPARSRVRPSRSIWS